MISNYNLLIAFMITLAAGLATTLGGVLVFFQKTPNPRILAFGLAFAGGAMVYVSLTEIFNKSADSFNQIGQNGFAYATYAFLAGLILSVLIDKLIPNPHETLDPNDTQFQEKNRAKIARLGMLTAAAITAHNLPEGLATFLLRWKILQWVCHLHLRLPFTIFLKVFLLLRLCILPRAAAS